MKFSWKTCFRICASVFFLYLCIFYWEDAAKFLGTLLAALSPLLLGLTIAYVLNILMSFYEQHWFPQRAKTTLLVKIRTPICLVAALITLFAIITLVVVLVVPELISCLKFLAAEIPPVLDKALNSTLAEKLIPASILEDLSGINWTDYLERGIRLLLSGLGNAVGTMFSLVSSVVSSVVTAGLSLIFAIYLLLSRDRLQRQGLRMLRGYLPKNFLKKLLHWLSVFNDCFHSFIVGQCVEAVILGVLCIGGMLIFGFPYAAMIGALVGFTALIPIAGAYIGAIVGALMILTESPLKALLFLVFIIVLQQLEGNLIYPRVVGGSIGLPALWVLAAITVGGSLMGVIGMLLGVPVAAALYRLLRENLVLQEKKKGLSALPEDPI